MKAHARWGVAGMLLGLVAALAIPSFAQTPSPTPSPAISDRTVTVTGTAIIRSSPDKAVVTLGVRTQAESAQKAMEENADKMSRVMEALSDAGLEEGDIATAWVNLYPNYDEHGLVVVSYTAENQVDATVHDMDEVGEVIDTAVAAGANLAGGISFQLSDRDKGVDRALQAAVADARSKAEILAAAGGATLGSVISITETGASTSSPVYYRDEAVAAATTPVSPPTLETQVSVAVVWSLS
ncbi:MAG: SIMPL domain-containing protein [Actinomycetota bacterium]